MRDKLQHVISLAGSLEAIKWNTIRGQSLTLGTMTDEHVANSLYYHKHLAEVSRVAPELHIDYDECKWNEELMFVLMCTRQAANVWSIDCSDFRIVG